MKLKYFLNEEEKDNMEMIHNKIKEFFKKNPNPPDDKIHALADSMGLKPDKFEEHIYMVLSDLLNEEKWKDQIPGGKADKKKPEDFDQEQLKMGIEIEMEHVDDKKKAEEIAMDHLTEIPDYYTRLKKMEKKAGVDEEWEDKFNMKSFMQASKQRVFAAHANKVKKARENLAKKIKANPEDLEFIGKEEYGEGTGYYFNVINPRHKDYKSTKMELLK